MPLQGTTFARVMKLYSVENPYGDDSADDDPDFKIVAAATLGWR
jgi:hypothetical protein